ncbi:GH39 family glycosyl hydrolase [Curtobacterium sp. SP.BCo]|uniref:GH39 family glycosyl hydrolase n=1 Tax=Curtobacterium sp. SP.BCo TaxID=3435229 RepID=UPI003F73E51A
MRLHRRHRALSALLAIGASAAVVLAPTVAHGATDLAVVLEERTGIHEPGAVVAFRTPDCPADTLGWRVTNFDGVVVGSGTDVAAAATRSLPAGVATTPGIYRLTVQCGAATGSTRLVRSAGPATPDPFFSFAVAGNAPDVVRTFSALGGGSYRQDLQWQAVEKTAGRFDFTPIDARVDRWIRDAGVPPLFVLDYGNVAHTGGSMTPPDMAIPAQRAAWQRFVTTTVQHLRERYPDADLSYEVWNEWNNFHGRFPSTPEAYLPLAEVTFHAIRSADPSARVVGPGVNAVSQKERDWMDRWFAAGGAQWVDAISVHPYSHPWAPEQCVNGTGCIEATLAALHAQSASHPSASGSPAPIWITEVGWPATGVTGVGEADLAAYLVRTHVLAAQNGVERVYTFELNGGTTGARTFGLVQDTPTGFEPRVAAAAYLTMQRTLAGMHVTGGSTTGSVRVVEFSSADEQRHVRVIWQNTDRFTDQQVAVPLPSNGTLVDPFGASKPVTPTKGVLQMTAKWSPRYLVWQD